LGDRFRPRRSRRLCRGGLGYDLPANRFSKDVGRRASNERDDDGSNAFDEPSDLIDSANVDTPNFSAGIQCHHNDGSWTDASVSGFAVRRHCDY